MSDVERVGRHVDGLLREMAVSGDLSGLPGEGKPLPEDPDGVGSERWAAAHLARNAGVRPAWLELRREIDEIIDGIVGRAGRHLAWLEAREAQVATLPGDRILETARATREADERVRAEIAAAVAEVGALVRRYDAIVPASMQLVPLTAERVFERAAGR